MDDMSNTKELEQLKRMIITYIDQGKAMERYHNKLLCKGVTQMIVPKERLDGFIEGLQVALKMIASIEKGE